MFCNIVSSIIYSLFIAICDTMRSIGNGIVKIFKKIFKKIFQIIPKTYNKIFEFFEKKGCSPRVSKVLAGVLTALFIIIIS